METKVKTEESLYVPCLNQCGGVIQEYVYESQDHVINIKAHSLEDAEDALRSICPSILYRLKTA
jgi:hypothetical protein